METWKDIKGYEGLYQISNKGRVKSLNYNHTKKEKILKPGKRRDGYLIISLYKKNKQKTYYIHRLVAEAFLPNFDNLIDVNHKDEDKSNNYVENLEWCSREYNINYGSRNERASKNSKGKKKAHKKILCVETNEIFIGSQSIIDKMFPGRSSSNIRDHLRGRTKSCFGYHFKYIDE